MPISKINTSSITDNSVTAGKIVAGAVDADIAAGSIDTAQIADDAVTADKLANAINTSIAAKLPLAGGTMTGTIADFRSTGIDDNSNALAMTIDANENIGLGSVPATDWHANYSVLQLGGQAGFWTHKAVGTGKALHISHNTEYDTGFKYIASDEASLYMQGDGGKHIFSTAAAGTAGNAISFSEKVRIDTDGLKFNGDTAASNALDDYEEGTWTPALTDGKTGSGNYVKIGRLVTVNFLFANIGGTGSTAQRVTALPFTSYTQNGGSYSEMYRIDFPSNAVDFILFTYASTTTLGMTFQVDDGVPIALTGAMLDHSSATLSGTITYQTS